MKVSVLIQSAWEDYKSITESLQRAEKKLDHNEMKITYCKENDRIDRVLSETGFNMAFVDARTSGGRQSAEKIRTVLPGAYMILLVGKNQSPLEYVTPSIMASSLLMTPLERIDTDDAVYNTLELIERKELDHNMSNLFCMDTKNGYITIPYHDIRYFESNNKKIILSAGKHIYSFCGTLEQLEKTLPDCFFRCHRGFIVNALHVRECRSSDRELILSDCYGIPISRSYKGTIEKMFSVPSNRNKQKGERADGFGRYLRSVS